jgi:NitT/TauT family transport system substrate-binding protein
MHSKSLFNLSITLIALYLTGCGASTDKALEPNSKGLISITLQTDWYAQAEHGGFYQAVAEGYYQTVGLDVTIIPGGPNAMTSQKVASGAAQFSISRSDDIAVHASRGVPLIVVAALMQHDPQALLYHEESGIETFEDLDGRSIMTSPGAVFVEFLRRQYGLNIEIIPLDYGMNRFLADKNFVQQCFITNEPYYVLKHGANARTLLIAESGFDPYRVIYTNRRFAQHNPEVVRNFVAASIRGWDSYMKGPRERANTIIRSQNPKMTEEFLAYSVKAMADNNLIAGKGPRETTGLIDPIRIQQQLDTLLSLGIIQRPMLAEEFAPVEFLPEELRQILTLE